MIKTAREETQKLMEAKQMEQEVLKEMEHQKELLNQQELPKEPEKPPRPLNRQPPQRVGPWLKFDILGPIVCVILCLE
jgi:hypothetical protein